MNQRILGLIECCLNKKVSGTGLGVFRILFGLVIIQEIAFLFYFRRLIFDNIPYIDPVTPWIEITLILWGMTAAMLTTGSYTRISAILNYFFWVGFLIFTPMWHDFDGGFDQLMISSSFLLIFLPAGNNLSIDRLRLKLTGPRQNASPSPSKIPVLCYYAPLAVSLGLLYFDAALHKLFSEFWLNGLGTWLPSTMPYYISPLDTSFLLNIKWLQMAFGYTLIVFQFCFIFLCYFKPFRIPLFIIGILFHIGIILSLNIYPFGFGMLVHYALLAPISWWSRIRETISIKSNRTPLYYDPQCETAWRFAVIAKHFDIFNTLKLCAFKSHTITSSKQTGQFHLIDSHGTKHVGFQALRCTFHTLRYTAPLGIILQIPMFGNIVQRIYWACLPGQTTKPARRATTNETNINYPQARVLYRFFILILLLQLNSTIYYGFFYRFGVDTRTTPVARAITNLSNITTSLSHTLLGITPHALYMDEHFAGYERILAITYKSGNGQETWLPFVNQQGRIVAPNWGRVHSMWANVAVRPILNEQRLYKFIRKVTAFWASKLGISLDDANFAIKMKRIAVPMTWQYDLRNKNLSGEWNTIGYATWNNVQMQMKIPSDHFLKKPIPPN